jgi:hypothetical protein
VRALRGAGSVGRLGSLVGLVAPLFVCVSTTGFIVAHSTGGALGSVSVRPVWLRRRWFGVGGAFADGTP